MSEKIIKPPSTTNSFYPEMINKYGRKSLKESV